MFWILIKYISFLFVDPPNPAYQGFINDINRKEDELRFLHGMYNWEECHSFFFVLSKKLVFFIFPSNLFIWIPYYYSYMLLLIILCTSFFGSFGSAYFCNAVDENYFVTFNHFSFDISRGISARNRRRKRETYGIRNKVWRS